MKPVIIVEPALMMSFVLLLVGGLVRSVRGFNHGYNQASYSFGSLTARCSTSALLGMQQPGPSKDALKNVQDYLQMRELMRMKNTGASYEELKEKSMNGTRAMLSKNAMLMGKPVAGYAHLVGNKGSRKARMTSIVAYKRANNIAAFEQPQNQQQLGSNSEDELVPYSSSSSSSASSREGGTLTVEDVMQDEQQQRKGEDGGEYNQAETNHDAESGAS